MATNTRRLMPSRQEPPVLPEGMARPGPTAPFTRPQPAGPFTRPQPAGPFTRPQPPNPSQIYPTIVGGAINPAQLYPTMAGAGRPIVGGRPPRPTKKQPPRREDIVNAVYGPLTRAAAFQGLSTQMLPMAGPMNIGPDLPADPTLPSGMIFTPEGVSIRPEADVSGFAPAPSRRPGNQIVAVTYPSSLRQYGIDPDNPPPVLNIWAEPGMQFHPGLAGQLIATQPRGPVEYIIGPDGKAIPIEQEYIGPGIEGVQRAAQGSAILSQIHQLRPPDMSSVTAQEAATRSAVPAPVQYRSAQGPITRPQEPDPVPEPFQRPGSEAAAEPEPEPESPSSVLEGIQWPEAPFSDPWMEQMLRQLAMQLATQIADLELQGSRLLEDANLWRPFMERRFAQQMRQLAGSVADRGFYGSGSGIMAGQLGELAEQQAFERGQFDLNLARRQEDIERAIAALIAQLTGAGAEVVTGGAQNASGGIIAGLPF